MPLRLFGSVLDNPGEQKRKETKPPLVRTSLTQPGGAGRLVHLHILRDRNSASSSRSPRDFIGIFTVQTFHCTPGILERIRSFARIRELGVRMVVGYGASKHVENRGGNSAL